MPWSMFQSQIPSLLPCTARAQRSSLCLSACWARSRSVTSRARIVTTTPSVEGRPIRDYLGVVAGETILGANIFKDVFAGIRDIVGGRSASYEASLMEARETAMREMTERAERLGANAVVGVDLDYEVINNMLMVSASGTAVRLG